MSRGGAADAPTAPTPIGATEAHWYGTVIDAARIAGWRVAHFRPARTAKGWRTAVQGDGKGFPDSVLVHAGAGRVWFVELKLDGAKPTLEQQQWGESLIRAGAVYRLLPLPPRADPLLHDPLHARTTPC